MRLPAKSNTLKKEYLYLEKMRKLRGNGERMRKWRENEERNRK